MDVHDLMARMQTAFPGSTWDVDDDGQIVVHTNLQWLTTADNPSIPEGEYIIQEFPA